MQVREPQRSALNPMRTASATITGIRTTIVNIPLEAPYRWVSGLYYGTTKVVVEIETADGVTGLGEASNWRHAKLIDLEIAPRLNGERATDLRRCRAVALPPVETLHNTEDSDIVRAYGAVEIALWDIRAKLANVPLYEHLGGAVRKRVPFTEYFAMRERSERATGEQTPEDLGAYCEQMVREYGSPYFEGKVGFADLETDIAIARSVREAIGPDRSLRLDANMGWRFSTAREALRRLAPFDLANLEDPASTYEDMARLRQHSSIPFSTHIPNLRAAVRLGVPDSFALNLTSLGGIEPTLRFVAACEATGIDFSFYSGETGIGVAAYLHVAAADPHLGQPSQSLLRWYVDDIIAGGPFRPTEGHLDVPEGPGLGVEVDRPKLEEANRAFQEYGPLNQHAIAPGADCYRHPPLY